LWPFARRLIVSGLSSLIAALMVYSIIWHWMRGRHRTWGPPSGGPT
jgi:hypothetical protein